MTSEKRTPKYPLSAPMAAGIDNLRRLKLNTETSMNDDIESADEFSELLISVHAPAGIEGMRLNVAATEDDFRQVSIDCIVSCIDKTRRYPKVKKVIMHTAPKLWIDDSQLRGQEGDYDRQIDGIRQIASFAAEYGIEVVLENNRAYFSGIPDEVSADQVDWAGRNAYFGESAEEWIQICEDVDRPNVGLCLDASHACTYAHAFADPGHRRERVMAFLAKPRLIRHVHWSDNYLYDVRGRSDSHACVGKGSLPIELHRAIKGLDATLLLEHYYTIEEREEEMEFIDRL